MSYIVQERSAGRFVIVPPGQPPLPVLFASPREAQDYAAALSAQDRADDPAPPLPLPQDNEYCGDGHCKSLSRK